MVKNVLLFCLFLAISAPAFSQNARPSSASQTVQMTLYPVIDIDFVTTRGNGAPVNLSFNHTGDYSDGVISSGQELRVRSNKEFKVSVQTAAANFSYLGNANNAPLMPVNNTLSVAITANNTGGLIARAFSNNYSSLSASSQDILLNGERGGDQKFAVSYKANPEYKYPAGVYSIGVVYTATQP